jgi:TetR/AcrR family transcriptional regulator, regulator of cefoperazone and chloramphenicol sensitivity
MSQATASSHGTADRLLAAAVEVFAELGYRNTTLREICQRAGANNAAVNYHFHDKEHLYLAVIEHAIRQMQAHVPQADTAAASPEERLRSFVHSMLRSLLGEGPPSWLMKLISQELAEPTAGLDLIIEKVMTSVDDDLKSIVRELMGPSASPQQVQDCVISVMAQCDHYHHWRAVLEKMRKYAGFDEATIEHLADHVTRFSLAGMRSVAGPRRAASGDGSAS